MLNNVVTVNNSYFNIARLSTNRYTALGGKQRSVHICQIFTGNNIMTVCVTVWIGHNYIYILLLFDYAFALV